jgi:WhiB family redox-sensing transcriptional regulator
MTSSNFDTPEFLKNGDAPCAETYPDMFFSDDPFDSARNVRATYEYENSAKKVCSSCPYRMECLDAAMSDLEVVGIWGGLTEKERVQLAKGTRGIEIRYTNRGR